MRTLLALVVLGGCGASVLTGSGSSRPAVIPKLSELPADPDRRDGVLDGAHYEPSPEQHAKLKPKERQAETIAATAAALIGSMFSKTQNVTIGVGSVLDPVKPVRRRPQGEQGGDDKAAPAEERVKSDDLVPWIRLQPEPEPQPDRPE